MGIVVVTGANGLVGARVCTELLAVGETVRGIVRRASTAPPGVQEIVGDFTDTNIATRALAGANAAVTTVYPMARADLAEQERVSIDGTTAFTRTAVAAGVPRLVHLSTAAVHERRPASGDVDETAPLVRDDAGDYPVTKRRTEEALARVDAITRVVLRPPAILGPGPSSVWNTIRPRSIAEDPSANPAQTFAWVHVTDLARLATDVARGRLGPDDGELTPVIVAGEPATVRDYHGAVTEALGIEPRWTDAPAWTGTMSTARAHSWGWSPRVTLSQALAELQAGLRAPS